MLGSTCVDARMAAGTNFSTNFIPMTSGRLTGLTGTEAQAQLKARTPGVYRNIAIYITTNSRTGAGTCKLRKNGADGVGSASITGSTANSWFEDLTGGDSVVAGDLVCYGLTQGSGSGAITVVNIGVQFDAQSGAAQVIGSSELTGTGLINTDSAQDQLWPFVGGANGGVQWDGTVSNYPYYSPSIRTAGRLSNLQVYIVTNTRTGATTFGTYINGAKGSGAVSAAGLGTGFFEDVSNSDTVASGDVLCCYATTSAATSKSLAHGTLSIQFVPTNGYTFEMYGMNKTAALESNTVNGFYGFGGAEPNATEVNQNYKAPFAFNATRLRVYYRAHNASTARTVNLRKNGATGNNSVSITTGSITNSLFEDTSHPPDNIAKGDLICLTYAFANTLGQMAWWALLGNEDAGQFEMNLCSNSQRPIHIGTPLTVGSTHPRIY